MSERIIPLTAKVKIREDKIPDLIEQINAEGISIPRSDPARLGIGNLLDMANKPVGVSVDTNQRSQGNYEGKVMHAQDKEQAMSVRRQFAKFFEEDSGT